MEKLFCDCKTDAEKSAFFLSGRAVETGVIAAAISNDVAMAYHRCDEYKKELDALQSQDREDAERWRYMRRKLCLTGNGNGTCAMQAINLPEAIPGWPEPGKVADSCDAAIDHARRIEGKRG